MFTVFGLVVYGLVVYGLAAGYVGARYGRHAEQVATAELIKLHHAGANTLDVLNKIAIRVRHLL